MERYNFQKIEKKWRDDPNATSVKKTENNGKGNTIITHITYCYTRSVF